MLAKFDEARAQVDRFTRLADRLRFPGARNIVASIGSAARRLIDLGEQPVRDARQAIVQAGNDFSEIQAMEQAYLDQLNSLKSDPTVQVANGPSSP